MLNRDQKYKVTGHEFLIKDGDSKAVLNTDLAAVRRHQERLNKVQKELKRDHDIQELQSSMEEIKAMLKQLLGQ